MPSVGTLRPKIREATPRARGTEKPKVKSFNRICLTFKGYHASRSTASSLGYHNKPSQRYHQTHTDDLPMRLERGRIDIVVPSRSWTQHFKVHQAIAKMATQAPRGQLNEPMNTRLNKHHYEYNQRRSPSDASQGRTSNRRRSQTSLQLQ
jgi:hypothetical protein